MPNPTDNSPPPEEAEGLSEAEAAAKAVKEQLHLKLRTPIEFGKQVIEEITMKPTARSFREFSLPMKQDGTILFQPYELAKVGVRMASQPNAIVDLMDPADMIELANRVMSFFVPDGPPTGTKPSP